MLPRAVRRNSQAPFTFVVNFMVPGPPFRNLVMSWAADEAPPGWGHPGASATGAPHATPPHVLAPSGRPHCQRHAPPVSPLWPFHSGSLPALVYMLLVHARPKYFGVHIPCAKQAHAVRLCC